MRDKAVKLLEDIEANKLPSLPHILVKLLQACRDENICFDTISEIISQDAALCTKVIKAANSPVYGRARHLTSLKHTLMFLGINTIKSIAITASIKQFFSAYSNQKTSFLKHFWHHSLSCATLAKSLAELTSYPYPEEAYIAGLLHDIGKLMLEPSMHAEYKDREHGVYPADDILQMELDACGVSHPELAAIMLEKWNIPDVICDAVRYHHVNKEDIQQAHQLAKIINLSSLFASQIKDQSQIIKTDAGIYLFDLSESIIERTIEQANKETLALASSIEIDIGDDEAIHELDEQKQLQLAQEVRDTALVQNSQSSVSIDSDEIFKSIQQSAYLLFGINNSLLMCIDDTRQSLHIAQHQYITDTRLFEDLKIDLQSESIISQSLNKAEIIDSFSTESTTSLSILDKQIAHGLKSDGFISIPITHAKQVFGALLLGVEKNKADSYLENKSLLSLFADNLSDKINQHLGYNKNLQAASNQNSEQFLQRAKQIIHETNNPLTVIRNYLQLLSKRLNEDDPAQGELNTIRDEIDRIGNIILRCKYEPDSNADQLSELNLNTIIGELVSVFNASLFSTHNIKSTLQLDETLNSIQSDKDIIKQIVTNLIKNSVEAIQKDGEIIITTGNVNINGKDYIELTLQDSGPGIPIEIMKNLYKPVSSTKGQSHSGLGLSITKNLLDRIDGLISCRTEETGTVFSIQFPEHIKKL